LLMMALVQQQRQLRLDELDQPATLRRPTAA
jgi:hypothetical protein